jgi:RNA polymerase sigma-70 factor (ECF subfamily)
MPAFSFPITTPKDWSETELLRRVLRQETRAWGELVRRYRPVIYRCIMKILGRSDSYASPSDVDEVYGEVMMSLVRDDMRKLRLWDPARGARLGSWIGLLAKNAAHDYIRGNASRPVADQIDGLENVVGADESPLDDFLAIERRQRLSDKLAEYSEKDREFLALYFGRGMSVEEVAVEMGISVKTVYTKKHKLLTRLASHMAPA